MKPKIQQVTDIPHKPQLIYTISCNLISKADTKLKQLALQNRTYHFSVLGIQGCYNSCLQEHKHNAAVLKNIVKYEGRSKSS